MSGSGVCWKFDFYKPVCKKFCSWLATKVQDVTLLATRNSQKKMQFCFLLCQIFNFPFQAERDCKLEWSNGIMYVSSWRTPHPHHHPPLADPSLASWPHLASWPPWLADPPPHHHHPLAWERNGWSGARPLSWRSVLVWDTDVSSRKQFSTTTGTFSCSLMCVVSQKKKLCTKSWHCVWQRVNGATLLQKPNSHVSFCFGKKCEMWQLKGKKRLTFPLKQTTWKLKGTFQQLLCLSANLWRVQKPETAADSGFVCGATHPRIWEVRAEVFKGQWTV